MNSDDVRLRSFLEMNAGGFPRFDGTIEFYSRLKAIVDRSSIVLDYGAGRGAGISEDNVPYRRSLKTMKIREESDWRGQRPRCAYKSLSR